MIKGIIYLITAEFCFVSTTIFAKYLTGWGVSPFMVTFSRFAFGFIVALIFLIKEKKSFIPANTTYVVSRGILNTVAVLFFFAGIQYTTITNANMLNMTYPVFIYLVAPFINKEKSPRIFIFFLILTMIGVFLVIHPDFRRINIGDLLCLTSGIIAAFGISSLREAGKYDNTFIIIFYQMAIGLIAGTVIVIPFFKIPGSLALFFLIASGFLGVFGQILLTAGYKYVPAKIGSLFGTSKIFFAMIFGIIIFADPLSFRIVSGGILIFISIIAATLISKKKTLEETVS